MKPTPCYPTVGPIEQKFNKLPEVEFTHVFNEPALDLHICPWNLKGKYIIGTSH